MTYIDKDKQRAAWRKYYHRQKQSAVFVRQKTKDMVRRQERVAWYQEYKKTLSCSRCPEKHPACLDFHHTEEKTYAVAEMAPHGYSVAAILAEVAKCVVLCANCHRKLHEEEQNDKANTP